MPSLASWLKNDGDLDSEQSLFRVLNFLAGRPFLQSNEKRGAVILRKTKKFQQLFGPNEIRQQKTTASAAAETLVFCDKSSGAPRFHVDMTGDREMAFNRAASLLALGCIVRGDSPSDYAVWVSAEDSTTERIKKHADELLHVGRAFSCSVDVSPREGEVLKELLHNRLNKEIADRLRISVRTVKFHVSSLLTKFGVTSRWDLIQKVRLSLSNKQLADGFTALQHLSVPAAEAQSNTPSASESGKQRLSRETVQELERRVVPFRSQLRPA